ncbi:NAD-dependent epimerase/dehydratase family protein [Microbacterium sp. 18062]|uniref:NAD-dependent epimerase/dehydratase family protein n=1 Tax=Microbacterium sp. 18062 TaxID=2681410 RepID=UPI00135BFA6B|nr:NAD-dependent epimerase/dehydratase family protein [Microbacterium sp. 18062]
MTIPARWIIGRGLLGSAVAETRGDLVFGAAVTWDDPDTAVEDLRRGLDAFMSTDAESWEIYWCAGKGVTSTPRALLEAEAGVFDAFVASLESLPLEQGSRTRVFLASSVGGAYAGSADAPFTELSAPQPSSAYGEVKLRMESALLGACATNGLSAFVARITNLYGPGQDLGKGQGLISVIVESYVTGRPVSIYVPLDTLRDYIYVDDCARIIDAGMRRLATLPPGTSVRKIVGSMRAVSVGAIMGETARLRRKPAPITSGQGNAVGQASDLRVVSVVWPDLDALASTTLPEGLGATYRSQLRAHMVGTR